MSEPSMVVKSLETIGEGLLRLAIHDERIDHQSNGYAVIEGGVITVIDPLPVAPGLLERHGRIGAIIIACPSHQRAAFSLRAVSGATIHAPAGSRGLDGQVDHSFNDGDLLPGGLQAVHAPGPLGPHYALRLERPPGFLFVADLLLNDARSGVRFLDAAHLPDPDAARRSVRRLLDLPFERLAFGHGDPILEGGRDAMRSVLGAEGGGQTEAGGRTPSDGQADGSASKGDSPDSRRGRSPAGNCMPT